MESELYTHWKNFSRAEIDSEVLRLVETVKKDIPPEQKENYALFEQVEKELWKRFKGDYAIIVSLEDRLEVLILPQKNYHRYYSDEGFEQMGRDYPKASGIMLNYIGNSKEDPNQAFIF